MEPWRSTPWNGALFNISILILEGHCFKPEPPDGGVKAKALIFYLCILV